MSSYTFFAKRFNIDEDILQFLFKTFCIIEQRGLVGKINGLKFEIRTKENGHNIAHVHVEYGEYQISIAIDSGKVLAGYLPKKQLKIATEWISNNKEKLNTQWKNIIVNCNLPYTGTLLPPLSNKEKNDKKPNINFIK